MMQKRVFCIQYSRKIKLLTKSKAIAWHGYCVLLAIMMTTALENVTQGQNGIHSEIDLHHNANGISHHHHQPPAGNRRRRLPVGNGDPVAPIATIHTLTHIHTRRPYFPNSKNTERDVIVSYGSSACRWHFPHSHQQILSFYANRNQSHK